MNLIDLKSVTFSYLDEQHPLLRDINLSMGPQEIVLIIGPTGSGKSTLLQVIAGVAPQVTGGFIEGSVSVDGVDMLHESSACRGKIGLVLQDPEPQLVNLTVEDEVAFGPENLELPREEIVDRLNWVIEQCRLKEVRTSMVYALSGGQKQRIAIAAGLAMKPNVLLMDGPLTNLDPMGATEVLTTIRELVKSQFTKTVLIASNKIDALLPLATRIIVLHEGQIVLDGTPEEILLCHQQMLAEIGLFLPEVSSFWPMLRQFNERAVLPLTPEDTVLQLRNLHPSLLNTDVDDKQAQENAPVIDIDNVSFGYGDNLVLKGVSFSVQKGEFLAVVGQNGSGKSTLMSLITGLRKPQQGSITVLGKDTVDYPPQGHVGFVFQYPEHQFVGRTIDEELRYGLLERLGAEELDKRVKKVLELTGLTERTLESPYTLSVGEKRMLSVATMLVLQPEILILDEPTTGLDRTLTANLMNILKQYVETAGMTVIQVTHDMEQVAEFCSRVFVIDQGKIIYTGTPRELFMSAEVLRQAKLEPPPVCQIVMSLFPNNENIPITVAKFLAEVSYASA